MSEHFFETTTADGVAVTVIIGYDRPLDYVFLMVEGPNGKMLYSNLSDPHAGTVQCEVDYYRPILESFGITLPEGIYRDVEKDQMEMLNLPRKAGPGAAPDHPCTMGRHPTEVWPES
jgi:hypothetical protein